MFHQVHLAASKGWPLTLMAGAFTVFAGCSLATLLLAGLPGGPRGRAPAGADLAAAADARLRCARGDAPVVATLFMGLLGVTTGGGAVLLGALWAELYGVAHLGAIRAFAASAMVFSAGLAPAIMGLLVDRGAAMEAIAAGSALSCLAASIVALSARQAEHRRAAAREG